MTTEPLTHTTVLLNEAVDALVTSPAGLYVDGTFGRGGHSRAILARLAGQGGLLVGIDRDPQAMESALAWQSTTTSGSFRFYHATIAQMDAVIPASEIGQFDGVLFDLGVSSPQIDQADRGFSFVKDGPLDMRMDNSVGETAADVVNSRSESELADIFFQYGEERKSRRIAKAIVEQREDKPFDTTLSLSSLVANVLGWQEGGQHPAMRCFQALRIYVNQELREIERGIRAAASLLKRGGRLVIISFHSLEDRIVKQAFNPPRQEMIPGIPAEPEVVEALFKQLGKAIKPSAHEVRANPRSRSAIMRIGVRQ